MHLSGKSLGGIRERCDPWLFFLLLLGAALAFEPDVLAQPAGGRGAPHLAFTYPAGGQQGTTFKVSLGGQNLAAAAAVHFSGAGLTAKISGYERPLTQKEINDLREEQQQLQDKRAAARSDPTKPAFTAANEERAAEIRLLLAGRGNRQLSPVLAETVTLEVTIAADAPVGDHELRLRTAGGLSNPMTFCVGALREFGEPPRIATSFPNQPPPNREPDPLTHRPKSEMEITLPAVVNGQILPGEVDGFHFSARRGQHIVIVAAARALLPYLADAVPGWFQATLRLTDVRGRELSYADDYRFNPDPVLCFEIPADGLYVLEIKDAIFRGREDFVYRVSVGELPFVTGVFPLGATCGERAAFDLSGWNLDAAQLAIDTTDRAPGRFLLHVRGRDQLSNPVQLALDRQRDCLEAEPNDERATAQPVTLPAIVNGRIGRPGDRDVFRFEGKAGDELVAEVFARRLGSPLDSVLTLTDASGRQLASNDDHEDKATGLLTHHADSRLAARLPADGSYFLTLADTQHQGGPDFGYRLHVHPPQPDFELRVTPSSLNLRAGASAAVTVYALRHDGFAGEIALLLKDAPAGFRLGGGRIPAGQDKMQVTLTAPFGSADQVSSLALAGVATIGGQTVAHAAVPAEDMMQAFSYRHLVAARALMVHVAGRGAPFRVLTQAPLRFTPGASAKLQIAAPSARAAGAVQFALVDPPAGISIAKVSAGAGDTVNVSLACDPAAAKPGTQGNLMLTGFGERPGSGTTTKAKAAQRVPLGAVPAIPFEIAARPAPSSE